MTEDKIVTVGYGNRYHRLAEDGTNDWRRTACGMSEENYYTLSVRPRSWIDDGSDFYEPCRRCFPHGD